MSMPFQLELYSAATVGGDLEIDRSQPAFAVVIHHDPRHTFKYCKALLREVFEFSDEDACTLCWTITTQGRASVWVGGREEATRLCRHVEEYQDRLDNLNAMKVDNDLDAGHPPMPTTIECVPGRLSSDDPLHGGHGQRLR